MSALIRRSHFFFLSWLPTLHFFCFHSLSFLESTETCMNLLWHKLMMNWRCMDFPSRINDFPFLWTVFHLPPPASTPSTHPTQHTHPSNTSLWEFLSHYFIHFYWIDNLPSFRYFLSPLLHPPFPIWNFLNEGLINVTFYSKIKKKKRISCKNFKYVEA